MTGKKVPAGQFLAKMAQGAVSIPGEVTRDCFAETLVAKPERLTRFILLLQASDNTSTTLRKVIADLTETSVRRLGIVDFPEPLDVIGYHDAVRVWLAGIRKKPLNPGELNRLFLLLHFGWQRQLIDHELALNLIWVAISKPIKPSGKSVRIEPAKTPIEVLLAAPPSKQLLVSLAVYAKSWEKSIKEFEQQIDQQVSDISRLVAESTRQRSTITELESEIATLKQEKLVAEGRIAELERQIVDLRDGYQHKLNEIRGRIRGVLQGQLTRWLETALDASRSEPPWVQAIQERLEDALKLVEKEIKWLQPSA